MNGDGGDPKKKQSQGSILDGVDQSTLGGGQATSILDGVDQSTLGGSQGDSSIFEGTEYDQGNYGGGPSPVELRQQDQDNIRQNIDQLKAIKPADDVQAMRIQGQIDALQKQLDRPVLGGLAVVRGTNPEDEARQKAQESFMPSLLGISPQDQKALLAGVGQAYTGIGELAGGALEAAGKLANAKEVNKLGQRIVEGEENIQELINSKLGVRGVRGAVASNVGQFVGAAPLFGGASRIVGENLLARFPESTLAKMFLRGAQPGANYLERLATSEIVGVPINAATAAVTPGTPDDLASTPEEKNAIDNANAAAKWKTFLIGVLGDALFSVIPHGAHGEADQPSPVPPSGQGPSPERVAEEAIISKRRAYRDEQRNISNKQRELAKAEWTIANPQANWRDLSKEQRATVFSDYNTRNPPPAGTVPNPDEVISDSNLNTSTPDHVGELGNLNKSLNAEEIQGNVQPSVAVDELTRIGNRTALERIRPQVDADPNLVWIFMDSNGLKGVNDTLGHRVGDQVLRDHASLAERALRANGIDPSSLGIKGMRDSDPVAMRIGGDEFVLPAPKDKADAIVNWIEKEGVKKYNDQTTSVSADIAKTFDDGQGPEAADRMGAKKVLSKAVHGINGRDMQEQALIEAAREELEQQRRAAVAPPVEGLEPPGTLPPTEPVPPVPGLQGNTVPQPPAVSPEPVEGQVGNVPPETSPTLKGQVGGVEMLSDQDLERMLDSKNPENQRLAAAEIKRRYAKPAPAPAPVKSKTLEELGQGIITGKHEGKVPTSMSDDELKDAVKDLSATKRTLPKKFNDRTPEQDQQMQKINTSLRRVREEINYRKGVKDAAAIDKPVAKTEGSHTYLETIKGKIALEDLSYEQLHKAYDFLKDLAKKTQEPEKVAKINLDLEKVVSFMKPGDELRTGEGTIGMGYDPELIQTFGASMYEKTAASTIVKEGIQNAIDAARGKADGRVHVNVDELNHKISIDDNGIGISPAVAEKQYVDVGGSAKEAGSAGGFGLAKIGIFSIAKRIYVRTIWADPDGVHHLTTIEGSGKTWIDGKMQMKTEVVPPEYPLDESGHPDPKASTTGTHLEIELPPGVDSDWSTAIGYMMTLMGHNHSGVKVTGAGSSTYRPELGVQSIRTKFRRDNGFRDKITLPGADIDIRTNTDATGEYGVSVAVLNNGIYQFSFGIKDVKGANIPGEVIADIHPTVSTKEQAYPFNLNRDSVKRTVRERLEYYVEKIGIKAGMDEAKELVKSVAAAPTIPQTRFAVLDGSRMFSDGLVEEIARSKYAETLTTKWAAIADEIAHLAHARYAKALDFTFGGISLNDKHLGVNIDEKILQDIATKHNIQYTRLGNNRIYINPFTTLVDVSHINPVAIDHVELAHRMANQDIATIIHELSHQEARGHREEFADVHTRVNALAVPVIDRLMHELDNAWMDILADRGDQSFRSHLKLLAEERSHATPNKSIEKLIGHNQLAAGGDVSGNDEGFLASWDDILGAAANGEGTTDRGAEGRTDIQRNEGPGPEVKGTGAANVQGAANPEGGSGNRTILRAIAPGRAVEDLTEREVSKLDDQVLALMDKIPRGSQQYLDLQHDLDALTIRAKALEAGVQVPNVDRSGDALLRRSSGHPDVMQDIEHKPGVAPVDREKIKVGQSDVVQEQMLMKKKLNKMTGDELEQHAGFLRNKLASLPGNDPVAITTGERLKRVISEQASRARGTGVVAQIPPEIASAALGFAIGYMKNPDQDEDRLTNALEWAAIGGLAGLAAHRAVIHIREGVPKVKAPLPAGPVQDEIRKHLVYKPKGRQDIGFLEHMRNIYTGIVRRTYPGERFQATLGASGLSVEHSGAKLLSMFGRWTGQTEQALKYGPAIFDEFGNFKKLDAIGIGDIIDMVDGDTNSLSDLMAARVKMEQGDNVKTPFNSQVAEMLYHRMPEKYHRAADEARKFSLAMAEVLADAGILSRDAVGLFKNETFYAPLLRIFKYSGEDVVNAEATKKAIVKAINPVKGRKGGGQQAIIAPFQSLVDMVPRFYRAAELNKIKTAWVDAWEAVGSPGHIMQRVGANSLEGNAEHLAQIKALQTELGLSGPNAQSMVAGLASSSLDELKGVMRVYRNGQIEAYRIPRELAVAMKSLSPDEFGMLTRLLGVPARLGSKGISMNPLFVARMAFYDMWQATMNSQYNFRPGIDNIRGWLHIVRGSEKYRNFLGVGGSHQALYGPGKLAISTKIPDIIASKGTPAEVAIKQLKTLHPIEAYKTLVTPFSDAARMGEYLRAKDHGASDIEAAWAAKQVTANYSEIGSFGTMRALQHMTMFLGPAVQVMDQAAFRGGVHPFRAPEEGRLRAAATYAIKAFMTIGIPSMYLWYVNKDDDEITQLRQTSFGRKYWFVRTHGGSIVRINKPPIDGQVFGSSVEAALDQMNGSDPQGMHEVAGAMLRDAAFNMLPSIGVIPYSLQANQDLGLGRPIVPLSQDQLAIENRGADNSTWLARDIAHVVGPMAEHSDNQMIQTAATPAGIDFLIRSIGGLVGQDAAQGASAAVEYEKTGYVPAKDELPLVKSVLIHYPTTSVRSVERFYDELGQVQEVTKNMNYLLSRNDPTALWYSQENQETLALARSYTYAGQTIANMRRSILDVKTAPKGSFTSEQRRQMIDFYTQSIIEMTSQLEQMKAQFDLGVQQSPAVMQK